MAFRERILKRIGSFVYTQHPFILVVAILLTIFSLAYSSIFLKTKTGRIDLVSESNPACKRFLEFLNNFGSPDNLVVLVEGGLAADRERASEELARRLDAEKEFVEKVFFRVPLDFFKKKGLHYADQETLREILERLRHPLKEGAGKSSEVQWQTPSIPHGGFLASQTGEIYFLFVKPTQTQNDFKFIKRFVNRVEEILTALRLEMPGMEFSLTGVPPIIYEEMVTTTRDVTRASVISFIGITLLFMFAFHAFRKPLMVAAVMFMGISWTFLFATVTIGSLNLMSIVFASMILGSGNDFGVHILMRYREERLKGRTSKEAIETVISQTGQGILSGAVATAAVFFTLLFSNFKGFAEFGLISGAGVLICCAAMLLVVPAFLAAWEKAGHGPAFYTKKLAKVQKQMQMPHVAKILRWPKTVVAASLAVTAYLILWFPEVGFNGSLLDIQAKNSRSFANEMKMMKDSPLSPRFAVVYASDLPEAKEKENKLRRLPAVGKVESVLSLMPESAPQKATLIGDIRAAAEKIKIPPKWLREDAQELQQKLNQLKLMAAEPPVAVQDLPESLRDRFVGKDGTLLLYVFPKKNIWADVSLNSFTEQIERVDPLATGTPFLIREVTALMERGYLTAGGLALLMVVLIIWLDFRRLVPTLLALVPLLMGVSWMVGLLGLLGLQFNPANLIALPLIFGISIDNGVHLVHRFFEQGAHRIEEVMKGTLKGVYLNSITTIVCFGALMLADHRGIASLGYVLVIGVTTCLVTAITFLPALLKLLSRYKNL